MKPKFRYLELERATKTLGGKISVYRVACDNDLKQNIQRLKLVGAKEAEQVVKMGEMLTPGTGTEFYVAAYVDGSTSPTDELTLLNPIQLVATDILDTRSKAANVIWRAYDKTLIGTVDSPHKHIEDIVCLSLER